MKTILQRLMCMAVAAMACMSVNAQETSGSCGDNATWEYAGTTLTISGTGAMADYNYGEAPWFAYAGAMKYVEIEAGITSVGSNAFAGFETLTSVTFPSSGFTSIGDYAFSGCTKLRRPYLPSTLTNLGNGAFSSSGVRGINIPAGVTTIGDYAFEACTSLDGVSIFEGVEEIGEGAFDGCALTSVAIPNSVTTIGANAFMSNEALESVFIGSGVANIGTCAFQGCTALKEVGLATATLPTLGDAVFDAGDGETPLAIDAFYVSSADLYSSGWAGYAADKFKTTYEGTWNYRDNNAGTDDPTQGTGNWSFDVPTGTLTVTGTGMLNVSPWMGLTAINPEIYTEDYPGFWYKVKSFVVGEGITGIQTMGVGMQINCASVSLPSTLTYVGYSCLEECAFTSIELPEGLETIDDYTFYGSKLTSLTIPSSVTYIGNSAFLENQDLATVTCLGTTPPTFGEYEPAFGDGSYLTAIYVPSEAVAAYKAAGGWSVYADKIQASGEAPATTTTFTYSASEKLTVFDNTTYFTGATAVKSHDFADGGGTVVYDGKVTAIAARTFYYNSTAKTKMTAITIPASVETIGTWAFAQCEALATVTFEGTSTLTTIESYAFGECKNLTAITLPESLTTLGDVSEMGGKTYYSGSVFSEAGLTAIEIPKNLTTVYGGGHFADCPLTSLTVNAANTKYDSRDGCNAVVEKATDKIVMGCVATTVPDGIKAIGYEAFFGESQSFSLVLPESVTSIEDRAFHWADGLKAITIPSGITTVTKETFLSAEGVTDVYCYASPSMTWNGLDEAFEHGTKSVKFHVAAGDLAAWTTNFPDANATFVGDLDAMATNKVGDDYWATYYNGSVNMKADANTIVYKAAVNGNTVMLTEITDNVITAGEAVILKSTATSIALTPQAAASTADYTGNALEGVDVATAVDANYKYYVLSNENSALGFYHYTGETLGSNKAFIKTSATGAPEFFVFNDVNTTSLHETASMPNAKQNTYFDLQGRCVVQPTKGMYIVNGKKVVIK